MRGFLKGHCTTFYNVRSDVLVVVRCNVVTENKTPSDKRMRFVFRPLASNSSAGVQRRRGAMRAAVLGLAAGVLLRPAKRPPDGPPALQILGMYAGCRLSRKTIRAFILILQRSASSTACARRKKIGCIDANFCDRGAIVQHFVRILPEFGDLRENCAQVQLGDEPANAAN